MMLLVRTRAFESSPHVGVTSCRGNQVVIEQTVFISKQAQTTFNCYISWPFRGVFMRSFLDFSWCPSFPQRSTNMGIKFPEPVQFECWDGRQCQKTEGWTLSEQQALSVPLTNVWKNPHPIWILISSCEKQLCFSCIRPPQDGSRFLHLFSLN